MVGLAILLCVALGVALLIWARAQGLIRPESRAWAWALAIAAVVAAVWAWLSRRPSPTPIAEQLEQEAQTHAVIEARRAEVRAELDDLSDQAKADLRELDAAAAPAEDVDELAHDLNEIFGDGA